MMLVLENKTSHNTKELHRVIRRCLREVNRTETNRIVRLIVEIVPTRSTGYSGTAFSLKGKSPFPFILLRVPKNLNKLLLATIFLHEYGHCLGIPHRRKKAIYNFANGTIEHLYKPWMENKWGGGSHVLHE